MDFADDIDKYKRMVNAFFDDLLTGPSPLRIPVAGASLHRPVNIAGNQPFSGLAHLILSSRVISAEVFSGQKVADPRWATREYAEEMGWAPKGRRADQRLVHLEYFEASTLYNEQAQVVFDEQGLRMIQFNLFDFPKTYNFEVFNAGNLRMTEAGQGILPFEDHRSDPVGRAKAIIAGSYVNLLKGHADELPEYVISGDCIGLPESWARTEDEYYSRILRELIRCQQQREFGWGTADEATAIEMDMRVAIANLLIDQELGLSTYPIADWHDLALWQRHVKADPYALVRAWDEAEKLKDRVLSRELELGLRLDKKDRYAVHSFRPSPASDSQLYSVAPEYSLFASSSLSVYSSRDAAIAEVKARNEGQVLEPRLRAEGIYLKIAWEDEECVKSLGAAYDEKNKSWFVSPGTDLNKFGPWLPIKENIAEALSDQQMVASWLRLRLWKSQSMETSEMPVDEIIDLAAGASVLKNPDCQ